MRRKLEKERDLSIEVIIAKITEENEALEKNLQAKFDAKISSLN
jgi:hypothetical protein